MMPNAQVIDNEHFNIRSNEPTFSFQDKFPELRTQNGFCSGAPGKEQILPVHF